MRRRYWAEVALAVVAGALALLTLVTREWIEILTGWDPDGGSGTLEWAIVAVCAAVAIAAATAAYLERRYVDPAFA
jgi:hypothetical protein